MNGGNAGIGPLMGIDKDGDGKPDDVVPGVVEALTCKTKGGGPLAAAPADPH